MHQVSLVQLWHIVLMEKGWASGPALDYSYLHHIQFYG